MTDGDLPECTVPSGTHEWETVGFDVEGHGSLYTKIYEECAECEIKRLRYADGGEVYKPKHTGDGYVEAGPGR